MYLRSKLTSEICQKLGSLDKKTKQNRLKAPGLPLFSQKTAVFIEKNDKRLSVLNYKSKRTYKFYVLQLKVLSEKCQ